MINTYCFPSRVFISNVMATFVLQFLCSAGISARELTEPSQIYLQNCAYCHENPRDDRTPTKKMLSQLAPEYIVQQLREGGRMAAMGRAFPDNEQKILAEYLTGKKINSAPDDQNLCPKMIDPQLSMAIANSDMKWIGWGSEPTNSRHQTKTRANLTAEQVPKLKLKWAFGFSGGEPRGQPIVIGEILLTSSSSGKVYALNSKTGCLYWTFQAVAEVRNAFSYERLQIKKIKKNVIFFGDTVANVYAVDMDNGKLLWKKSLDNHPNARITGSPLFNGKKLFVPVSSHEEVSAMNPGYQCCSFRGSLAALDPISGKIIWQTYTIKDPLKVTRKAGADGKELKGPSGGGIWSSPTYDAKLNRIYVGTGNDYSLPTTKNTDAILAINAANGKIVWVNQVNPGDTWNLSCSSDKLNCAKPNNENSDRGFGSSTILKTFKGGKRILLAGSKGGVLYALDPDHSGKVVWRSKVGEGGFLGGIEWGFTIDDDFAYVGVGDFKTPQSTGFLTSLRLSNGDVVWSKQNGSVSCEEKIGCKPAILAALTSIPGVVFAGTIDGFLRAFSAQEGNLLWQFITKQEFKAVNGITAKGGSINGTGPVVVDGMVYVTSGYGHPGLQSLGGNALLAFSL